MALIIDIFPARADNLGYLAHDAATGRTAAIDAPDAGAISAALERRGWNLTDILITHHHRDHVEGIGPLKSELGVTVWGPRAEMDEIGGLDRALEGGDTVPLGETEFTVLETPGHTLGHIAFYNAAGGHLFTGDALFSLGVGRMFEGTPEPMWRGLEQLRALPETTLIYCGHEYTLANSRFALSVEPGNAALGLRAAEVERMRAEDRFTVPVSLAMELATNPFLRADRPEMARAMGLPRGDAVAVFAALRRAKDDF